MVPWRIDSLHAGGMDAFPVTGLLAVNVGLLARRKKGRIQVPLLIVYTFMSLTLICGNLSSLESLESIASIRSYQDFYYKGEAIAIDLTIRNVTDSSIVVFPTFVPPLKHSSPDTIITFEIIGPDGIMITRSRGGDDILRRMAPNYCMFRELPPRWHFGGPIYLNRWPHSYTFDVPGVYRIKAKVEFKAREWLKTIDPAKIPAEIPRWFSLESVIDGTVETNQIMVEIRAQSTAGGTADRP